MNVLDWLQPFSEPDCGFTVPLSLTLLHFLWQGCVIAGVAYAIGWLLQRSAATIRYWLYVGMLLLMVACVSATFAIVSTFQNRGVTAPAIESEAPPSNLANAGVVVGTAADPPIGPDLPTAVLDQAGFTAERLGSLSKADQPADVAVIDGEYTDDPASKIAGISPWLTAFYFAGVAVMLLRLTRSLWSGHRLKRESTVVDDEALLAMIKRQARLVGLKTAPAVALCSRVTVLTVIGIIKPVILLPASLAMELAPQQLEALLAHELAHIRRFDLVVNLLQRFIEALLFFHPAVWFISRRVSIERERACDDTVVAAGWQRVNYADALVRMAELSSAPRKSQLADRATALATSGGKPSDLKRRVLRLLGHDDLPKVRLTQAGLTMFVVVLALAVLAPLLVRVWAQPAGVQPTGGPTERAPDLAASDAEVPRNETEPGKSPKPGKGDGRDIVPRSNGLPNEQKLSGKWYGEKDGIEVRLTFHSPAEARWKVDTGCAGIGVSFRNVIDEEAGVINLWLDYKWVTGDKKGQSGSQVLGQVRDGARETLLLNIMPTDLYPPSHRYKPVNDVVLTRAVSKDADATKPQPSQKLGTLTGRFTLKIEAGTNDLGVVRLPADSFEEKDEGEKAKKRVAPSSDDPIAPQSADRQANDAKSETVDHLIERFSIATYPWQQLEVARELVALGDTKIIPKIQKYLDRKDRRRRCNAALVLAGLGDKRGLAIIIGELQDKAPRPTELTRSDGKPYPEGQIKEDRYYAASLLGHLGNREAVPALIQATKDETINYRAAISLGEIGDKSATPALREMATDFPEERLWAGYGLAALGKQEGFDILTNVILSDSHWTDRRHAVEALGKIGHPKAVPTVVKALEDKHVNVRVSAARALGAIRDPAALPALTKALSDTEATKIHQRTTVENEARKAIEAIKSPEKRGKRDTPTSEEGRDPGAIESFPATEQTLWITLLKP